LTREPSFEELVGAETTGAERERLRHAHELLLQAGPPAELPPGLRKAPSMGVVSLQERRRVMKRRTLVLLAAALTVVAVFFAGYAVSNQGHGTSPPKTASPTVIPLKGTALAPRARATLEVWHSRDGNLPMRLNVVGLRKLPPHSYYDVYLVRNGQLEPWGLCGSFVVGGSSRVLTLKFNAPYGHEKGDSWVVTRPGPGGTEPGKTVLRPVTA
jgi:hypothetical protein